MGARLSYPEGIDLNGKVAIVTGGNNGIGYETTKALSFMGAHTIIACRSEERAREAIDRLKEEGVAAGKEVNVEIMKLDLASLESTKKFIKDFKQKNLPLHLLICNAGIALVLQGKTENNFEQHFQTNHLGHFLICLELLPCMMNTEGDKRIVLVSSMMHSMGAWDPNNLQGDTSYGRIKFYGNSKLYNIMTMYALQRRAKDCGITVSSLHPGTIKTDLWHNFSTGISFFANAMVKLGMGRSVEEGAVTTINCAVNSSLNSQQAEYYSEGRPIQASRTASCGVDLWVACQYLLITESEILYHASSSSRNEQYQEELWSISCELLKEWMSPEIWDKYGPTKQNNGDNGRRQHDEEQQQGDD